MKSVLSSLMIICMLLSSLACLADGVSRAQILRVSDGVRVTLSNVMDDLRGVQLVFVGELHDNPNHHQAQLAIIGALKESGVSVAIGLEMFRSGSQTDLDRWVKGALSEDVFQNIYYENWTTPWPLYRDIFLYARKKRIPMIGLNVPPAITRQVARQGFASLTQEQLGVLPQVSCRVDEAYMAFIRRAFGSHQLDENRFIYFCEAQMVWDTAMASNLLSFLKKNPGYTIAVLAGSGHAWKRGIPEQIRRQSKVAYRVILPEISGRLESETVTLEDTDYLWLGL